MVRYSVIRFHKYDGNEIIWRNKTMEFVRQWCSDKKTHGVDWFDGWVEDQGYYNDILLEETEGGNYAGYDGIFREDEYNCGIPD